MKKMRAATKFKRINILDSLMYQWPSQTFSHRVSSCPDDAFNADEAQYNISSMIIRLEPCSVMCRNAVFDLITGWPSARMSLWWILLRRQRTLGMLLDQ